MDWLTSRNWQRWIGDAALAIVLLILASVATGAFDAFTDVQNASKVAGFFGLAVWFGMPFLGQIIPASLSDYISIATTESPPLSDLLFGLSAPVVALLAWSFLVW